MEAKHWSQVVEEIVQIVRERKVVDVAELANMFGYTYSYFRYFIMKQAVARSKNCIEVVRNIARWVCQEGRGGTDG